MGTPSTNRYQLEALHRGEKRFEMPEWQESMEEVRRRIEINSKHMSWRVFDRWTGKVEYHWASTVSKETRQQFFGGCKD